MRIPISIVFLGGMLLSFSVFGKEKILDLGTIEIQGEVRRPNIQLVYSKKQYFKAALSALAKEELRSFEQELLQPGKLTHHKNRGFSKPSQ